MAGAVLEGQCRSSAEYAHASSGRTEVCPLLYGGSGALCGSDEDSDASGGGAGCLCRGRRSAFRKHHLCGPCRPPDCLLLWMEEILVRICTVDCRHDCCGSVSGGEHVRIRFAGRQQYVCSDAPAAYGRVCILRDGKSGQPYPEKPQTCSGVALSLPVSDRS